jgi:serine/threonine protein kinase
MNDLYPTIPPTPIDLDKIAREQPQRIGRYRVERILSEGGFGVVYLAHDEQLQRRVGVVSVQESHSDSVIGHSFPSSNSNTKHPLTCGPLLRQWFRISVLSQPASSRASARTGRRSKARSS